MVCNNSGASTRLSGIGHGDFCTTSWWRRLELGAWVGYGVSREVACVSCGEFTTWARHCQPETRAYVLP